MKFYLKKWKIKNKIKNIHKNQKELLLNYFKEKHIDKVIKIQK